MERTFAASAMEWSIQLEKGLRSKKPGGPVEAILRFGPQLQQWSVESESNIAANSMSDLMAGEDRLFANAILLRLADAFACGDTETRFAIVTIFLSELKHRGKMKHKRYKGLLTKDKVPNHLELLKRVKSVYDSGDEESKAFALVLFGCWADFAHDNAHIRYLVLSNLVSPHAWLVKTSLFASGCFCEISDDFASTALEMLVNMVTSSEISLPVKLDAARVFGKFRCSYSVANKAYKTGLELILNSSDEEFFVVMFFSLSKLASVSSLLISEQVRLLLSFLSQERTSHIQETALICLKFLVKKGLHQNSVNSDLIHRLLCMLEEPEVSLAMHCEALQVLHKVLACMPPLPSTELHEFDKLVTDAENAIHHADLKKGYLAIHILADLSCKFVGDTGTENGVFFTSLPSRVVSLIKDQIKLLVMSLLEARQNNSWLFWNLETLLNILLSIIRKHHHLVVLVLDSITLTIEFLVNVKTSRQVTASTHVAVKFDREENTGVVSKFFCKIYRFLVAFLETLGRTSSAFDSEAMNKVQILVEFVCQCGVLDCYTYTRYCLLLHSQLIWGSLLHHDNGICDHHNLSIYPHSCPANCKIDTVEFVNHILTDMDNWTAYRIGTYAACQGELHLSSSIFSKLIQEAKSSSCCNWLKALSQYTQSEGVIQLLNLPKQGVTLVEGLENNKCPLNSSHYLDEKDPRDAESVNDHHYNYKLAASLGALCSSIGLLEANVTSSQAFSFQRWYLSLKARFLENVEGIHKVVRLVLSIDWGNGVNIEGDVMLGCLKSFEDISRISFQFYRLAEEFDLIGTSFIEMDSESSAIVAALSLSCSLLAFVAGFAVFVVKQLSYESFMVDKNSCNFLLVLAMQNLAGWLQHMDHETNSNFSLLLNFVDRPTNCFHRQPRHQTCNIGFAYRDFVSVYSNVVSEAVCLANKVRKIHNEITLSEVSKNVSELILDTITKWIHAPPRIPKYFFKVRQVIGSELFVHNEDTKNGAGISIFLGSHLSLNLCLQLKNLLPNLRVRPRKLYCILYCPVLPTPCGLAAGYEAWKDEDIVEMNKKLFRHVSECMANKGRRSGKHGRDENVGKNKAAETFVEFVPNQKGQGFSSCLLDVSDFPVGSYRIKWHSCLLDTAGSYWSLLPLNMVPLITVHT